MRAAFLGVVAILGGTVILGCGSSGSERSGFGTGGGGGLGVGGTGGSIGIGGNVTGDPNADTDLDGFTGADGDCNDGVAQINPGAYDFPGNGIDEDCNGAIDDEAAGCDGAIDLADNDPVNGARAVGVCRLQQGASWGLVSASYVKADGTPGMNDLSHGVLPDFGLNVPAREGANMLVLSSGTARRPGNVGWQSPEGADMATTGSTPAGYPVAAPACPGVLQTSTVANDPAALEMVIRTPTNANAIRFEFNFYTYEFPFYICSDFNDFFVALVDPAPAQSLSGNVSFDNQGNPVSVNNAFLEVCEAQNAGGLGLGGMKFFPCPQGTALLEGSGFESGGFGGPPIPLPPPFDTIFNMFNGPHAATGWLATEAPVPAGQDITVRFAVWDAGDHVLDSTVLIDNFSFVLTDTDGPVTLPVPR